MSECIQYICSFVNYSMRSLPGTMEMHYSTLLFIFHLLYSTAFLIIWPNSTNYIKKKTILKNYITLHAKQIFSTFESLGTLKFLTRGKGFINREVSLHIASNYIVRVVSSRFYS